MYVCMYVCMYNLHDVFNKVMVYNILNLTLKNHLFWYDLKLSSFLKMKHKISNLNMYIFTNSYLLKNY
jgi:hypothetical protein